MWSLYGFPPNGLYRLSWRDLQWRRSPAGGERKSPDHGRGSGLLPRPRSLRVQGMCDLSASGYGVPTRCNGHRHCDAGSGFDVRSLGSGRLSGEGARLHIHCASAVMHQRTVPVDESDGSSSVATLSSVPGRSLGRIGRVPRPNGPRFDDSGSVRSNAACPPDHFRDR